MSGKLLTYEQAEDAAPIRAEVKDDVYEFPAEAPLAVAMEWLDYNTNPERSRGDAKSEQMQHNYKTIFGEETYALLVDRGVGYRTVYDLYLDLLHEWGLFTDPQRRAEREGRRSLSDILAELREVLADSDDTVIAEAVEEMTSNLESIIASATAEETATAKG